MVHIHARPSAPVEDAAIRLIRAGYLGAIRPPELPCEPSERQWILPSERQPGTCYCVTLTTRTDTLRCTCLAGRSGHHCKHQTIIQLLLGHSAHWPPPPLTWSSLDITVSDRASLPVPSLAHTLAAAEPITLTDLGAVRFGHTGCGVALQTWTIAVEHGGLDLAAHTIKAAILDTVRAGGHTCALCRQPLQPYGHRSLNCPSCGLIIPRTLEPAAA